MTAIPQGLGPAFELVGRLGLDVLSMFVLVGLLYRRRLAAPEMPLVFSALNVGLFAAVIAIAHGDFPTGVGFGLFGLLSLVRLRSTAFTLRDVAYTFIALVLGLVNGLSAEAIPLVVALDVILLAVIWVSDESRNRTAPRTMRITLDRLCPDLDSAREEVIHRLGVVPLGLAIADVDFVRETTRVWIRYAVDETWGAVPDAVVSAPTGED